MEMMNASSQPGEVSHTTPPDDRGLVSLILATYNESENILEMIRLIFEHVPDPVEIIVVDDNSPDRTWEIARSNFPDPRVKVICRTRTRGLASAINRGIIESQGEFVGWMDADTCHPPTLLPAMLEQLQEYDVAIGSRYIPGGKDARDANRVFTSRVINGMATLVLGYGVRDYDSGFILMHRSVLDAVSLIPSGYGSYFIEFIYACQKKGLKVVEIPYVFHERTRGESKSAVNIFQFGAAGLAYVMHILRARFKKFD